MPEQRDWVSKEVFICSSRNNFKKVSNRNDLGLLRPNMYLFDSSPLSSQYRTEPYLGPRPYYQTETFLFISELNLIAVHLLD